MADTDKSRPPAPVAIAGSERTGHRLLQQWQRSSVTGMAPLKRIIVEVQGTANASLTHQVRNFGEDLWRLLEQSGLADLGGLEEIDRVTDKIEMRIHHSRKISTVRRIVQAELRRHFLEDRTLVHWS